LPAQDPPSEAAVPAPVPLSKIAPVKDLMAQKDYFVGRVAEALESKDGYIEAMQDRLFKDASVLAVILQGLALHDEDNPLKSAAPGLRAQVKVLIERRADYDVAKAEFDRLDAALKNPAAGEGAALTWDDHPELGQVMLWVSTYNSRLRRGSSAADFESRLQDTAEASAVVALIGQAIITDTHEVMNPDDKAKWYEFAAKLRDLSGEINSAVVAKDQAKAGAAYAQLYPANCTACHETFRVEAPAE
jgi:hypothetical protein